MLTANIMSSHSVADRPKTGRPVSRIGLLMGVVGLIGCVASPAFTAPDPLEIMRKVVRARGTVAFEADRKIHIINNGEIVRTLRQKIYRDTGHKERIETFTTGQSKSHVVVCDGRQMWEYWPSRSLVITHPTAPTHATDDVQNCMNLLYQGMSLTYTGQETVARRPAHVVVVRNKSNTLVRKTWIDTSKYVELKTQKYHGGTHPYMRVVVTRISYLSRHDDGLFHFKPPGQVKTKQVPKPPHRSSLETAEKTAGFSAVVPNLLPDGYVFERDAVAVTRYMNKKTLWLTFTNGLETFSLFETPCDRETFNRRDTKHRAHQWYANGVCFTLIGHLSQSQIQKITNSTQ